MSSMELRKIEDCKIECAKKFFSKITSDEVKYDVVDGVGEVVYYPMPLCRITQLPEAGGILLERQEMLGVQELPDG